MENATKALIIAGSVLIALMIIGALLLMFNNLSSYQETNVQGTREAQVLEFNNQYETYNRKNVRGSDLYSLLNRAIDYNRRKSVTGTGASDQGQYLAYQEMKIEFEISGEDYDKLSANGEHNLITGQTYRIEENAINNKFETNVIQEVKRIEGVFGSDSITNLATNITKIFPTSLVGDNQKKEVIINFNRISKKKKLSEDENKLETSLKELQTMKDDIYKYYEYVQFKRLHFDCIRTTYNDKTGRIITMEFESNGKFN